MLPIIGVLYPPPHASLTCIVFIYIQIESLNCVVLYCKGRFTLHNFCLKLSHATCLQLELYCVNQAHNLRTNNAGELCSRLHACDYSETLCSVIA